MIKRPQPIKELSIEPLFGPLVSIGIASRRAFEWMEKEAHHFGHYTVVRESNSTYATASLVVSDCYKLDEVVEFLSNPQYDENKVLKIAGEENGGGESA